MDFQSVNGHLVLYTIGHSTRSIQEFISLLIENKIDFLADVRQFPFSKRYTHFNKELLKKVLEEHHIHYEHFVTLGGRRPALKNSKNVVWKNPSFRGYADYMETDAFKEGIADLLKVTEGYSAAIMCSEAVWWRCHRSMISDYLKSIGIEVSHILSHGKIEPHPYTSPAKIINGKLSYEDEGLFGKEILIQNFQNSQKVP